MSGKREADTTDRDLPAESAPRFKTEQDVRAWYSRAEAGTLYPPMTPEQISLLIAEGAVDAARSIVATSACPTMNAALPRLREHAFARRYASAYPLVSTERA